MARKNLYESSIKDKLTLIESWKRDGLTDEEIMKNLGISKDTFYKYKNKYSEFNRALKNGREIADITVENALFKRAIGYTVEEETIEIKVVDGKETKQKKIVKKHIAGDVTAQIFWLKNRKSSKWKDRPEVEFEDNNISINVNGVKRNGN